MRLSDIREDQKVKIVNQKNMFYGCTGIIHTIYRHGIDVFLIEYGEWHIFHLVEIEDYDKILADRKVNWSKDGF